MSKWVPDSNLDLQLNDIIDADYGALCLQQPATFFEAYWPDLWVSEATYAIGDMVHPPTPNGYIYECTVAGDAGVGEPAWGTVQDATFVDGTVTWKTHENHTLAGWSYDPGDKTIADAENPDTGRTLTFAGKLGPVTHRAGTVTHTAFTDTTNKLLKMVTTASTSEAGSDDVDVGKSIVVGDVKVNEPDPV